MKLHLSKGLCGAPLACPATLSIGLPTTLGPASRADAVYFDAEQYSEGEYGTLVVVLKRAAVGWSGDSQYSGREQACVPCAVNRCEKGVAEITDAERCSYVGIEKALVAHIVTESTVCVDDAQVYNKLAVGRGLMYVRVDAHCSEKSCYSIWQCANVYHSGLGQLIRKFCSISTKHLSNYLMWCNFAMFAKETLKCAKRYQHAME